MSVIGSFDTLKCRIKIIKIIFKQFLKRLFFYAIIQTSKGEKPLRK